MNKQQLAEEISNRVGASRAQMEKALDALTRIITEKLIAGEDVTLSGFGAFSSKKRKGRVGVNPRNTSEQIEIPDTLVAKFKPGKNLKDALKRADKAPMPEQETQKESDEKIPTEQSESEIPTSEKNTVETPEKSEEEIQSF